LFSKEYTQKYIIEHQNDMTVSEIAKEMGLSERRIRQILKEVRELE
jgi:predicted transcriptional regulator